MKLSSDDLMTFAILHRPMPLLMFTVNKSFLICIF